MSDKKISELTASTTPLAGTEVLPIVQSSTTKKVSVANLTAGRTVQVSKLESDDGTNGRWTIEQAGATNNLQSATTGFGDWKTATIQANPSGVNMTWDTAGNTTVGVGNLVIGTSGKGIDFSANTGTPGMTSELLDWYEEGVYTATMVPTTSGTITLAGTHNTLSYTRIGRMVTVTGMLMVDTIAAPVGAININLPFAAAAGNAFNSAAALFVNGSNGPLSADFIGQIGAGASTLAVYLGDGNFVQADSADAMQANTQVTISASYFA